MPDQILDRRTVYIPGPMGDVTPEAIAARDAAAASAQAAEISRSSASAAATTAQNAADAAEAAAFPTLVTDWDQELSDGRRYGTSSTANQPLPSNPGGHTGEVNTATIGGATYVWQTVMMTGTYSPQVWTRHLSGAAGGTWTSWQLLGGDTGWENLSSYLIPGVSGTFQARALGETVEIVGNVSATGGFPSSTSVTDFFSSLPARFRPSGTTRLGAANAGGFSGSVAVRSNGTGGVWQRSGTAWSTALFSVMFHRG